MIDNVFNSSVELLGPLKINGTSKPGQLGENLTGWFYPLFINRSEAIQEDIDRGGKGIYRSITFFGREGEFYYPDTYIKYGEDKDPLVYTLYEGAGTENPFSKIQNKLSILVEDQLPDFIQSDYSMFVKFIKAYYEFLEQNNQAQETLQNIATYSDIDTTSEELVTKFLKNYAIDITKSNVSDNRLLIKKIREIYSRKGTEAAYKLLFNILYKETIDFFYPYDLVLKASDGKWRTAKVLRVKQTEETQDIFDFINTEVKGSVSGATAIVNNVHKINVGSYDVFELSLDEHSIKGEFNAGEKITTLKNISLSGLSSFANLSATLYSVISRLDVINGSLGYAKGHPIQSITDTTGINAKATVSEVNRFGSIVKVDVTDPGINYSDMVTIVPGLPTEKLTGSYVISKGVVTITFPKRHDITRGTLIDVNYVGNVFSPVDNTNHSVVVTSVPNIRSIRFKYPGY